MFLRQHHRQAFGVLGAAALTVSLTLPGLAEQVLKNLEAPIEAQLQTAIQQDNVQVAQPFTAGLTEPVRYQNWALPTGTQFNGQVVKVGDSRRFRRPGYVILKVEQVHLPDGKTIDISSQAYTTPKRKLHNPYALSVPQAFVNQLPYTAVSTGTSVPLRVATDLNGGVVFAITEGARIVTGGILGLMGYPLEGVDMSNKNALQRLGLGLWDGTGVPRVWGFVKKPAGVNFQPGDPVDLHFDPAALQTVMQTGGI